MLGAIAGDIIGSVYEWRPAQRIDFPLFSPASTFTDDSVLTVATAEKLLTEKGYADLYRRYGRRYPDAGYGGRFKSWIFDAEMGPYNSYGNGSAMRIAPVGWAFDALEETLAEAERSARPTHDHPEGIRGAQAVAGAMFMARDGRSKEEIRRWLGERFHYDMERTAAEIRPRYGFDVTCQGSVPEALIAFLEADSFEAAVRNAVFLGGDADTQGAIAGAVAEAFFGGVPAPIARETVRRLDHALAQIVSRFRKRFRVPA